MINIPNRATVAGQLTTVRHSRRGRGPARIVGVDRGLGWLLGVAIVAALGRALATGAALARRDRDCCGVGGFP